MNHLTVLTEDGVVLHKGDHAYNYYDMKPGIIFEHPDEHGWFWFRHEDGSRSLLNGQRICSDKFARRKGFPGA